jgi:deoxyribonuclease-4
MRAVGLHLRITDDLVSLAQLAHGLSLDTFQCFMIHQPSGTYINAQAQRVAFLKYRPFFKKLYLHASYWINLAGKQTAHTVSLLEREIAMARLLEFNAIVLHPGAATGWQTKDEGIEQFVSIFDPLVIQNPDIAFILENTAHGGPTIGSDCAELQMIRERMSHPEKISFCIDTAHAYSYGYDFTTEHHFSEFMSTIEKSLGFSSVSLVHLNDTIEKLGEKKDRHAFPGQGVIGLENLKKIVTDTRLSHAACILELPEAPIAQQIEMVNVVKEWKK